MNTRGLFVLAIFAFTLSPFAQQLSAPDQASAKAAMASIRPEQIRAHMRFLADTLLQGRAPGTPGYEIAAHYVASELEGMGLAPAGTSGSWYQTVPLRKGVTDAAKSSFVLVRDGKEEALADAKDYVFSADTLRPDSSVDAPLVFVGFGVTAPEEKYDDYAGVDAHGKIVVSIYGAPSRFPSTERAYYSDGVVKAKNAVEHGAVGTLDVMLPEDQKRYPWQWLVPQIQAGGMHWADSQGQQHDVFPELKTGALLNQTAAEKLFAGASKSLDQAFASARKSEPQGFPLAYSARIHTVNTLEKIDSSNIVGKLTGSDPALRDQYVVYTAHVDHLGVCPAVQGDNVCHGAVDNASGTSALLEVARAYSRLPRAPKRSVVFVFVTGEEMGLLGSDYYAHFPTVPLKQIVANVNIDGAPGVYYPMKDVVALGAEHSSLGADVDAAARALGYAISPDPMPEEVFFIRSDQYSFVLQGVPAVDLTDGINSTDPNIHGLEVVKKWMTTRYHTPLDNIDQPLDYASAAKGATLNFLVGYEVAQQPNVPEWNKGDFFGAKFGLRHTGSSSAGD
ncbi:MAG TPA: M28 family metallopeptidase [Terriglobales bacterium]|nr:M28 family metallopeptidase [Terriglobales bacterium]